MTQQVSEIMSKEPMTLEMHTSAAEAARAMRDADIGAMLVCEGEKLRGMLTDRDIVVRAIAEGKNPAEVEVGQICSTDVGCLSPQDDVDDAVKVMRERHVRRIPVLEGAHPVGIVSIGDLAIARDRKSALADISAAPGNR